MISKTFKLALQRSLWATSKRGKHSAVDKVCKSAEEALAKLKNGDTLSISGFSSSGVPVNLVQAVLKKAVKDLTIVAATPGNKSYQKS
jgi:acyl CoA:acetate/3-ketoacid CoA transferase alpha subunit